MTATSPEQDPLHRQYWEKKLTLPINHPFWEEHRPGDRWNCKCTLKQTDEPTNDEVIRDFYPVPAQPGLDNNPADNGKLFSDSHPYIAKAYVNARGSVVRRGATLKELTADLNKATAEVGRYHMGYAWKKGGKHGAHIITIEKLPNGSIRIYDQQSGDILQWKDIAATLDLRQSVIVYRVDNLHINTDLIDQIVVTAAE